MTTLENTKIVATLGPASSSKDVIRALAKAGADVFRLNMSHGAHADQKQRFDIIREVEAELGWPIGILADLQGPKIRCGVFENDSYILENGQTFVLDSDEAKGDATRVRVPHPEVLQALKVGSNVLINDGKLRLRVTEVGAGFVSTVVEVGGAISDRKGINLPDVVLPMPALSAKDRADLEFACELGVDWIALSFVQRARDVIEAKTLINGRASIISKIEKPAAIEDFDAILEESDGIMVARGDLGVELPVAQLPPLQKRLVHQSRQAGKPVIVATQMLESMITSPVPTRAEVSDVATAIYDGADAVMLSAETAAGDFPVEAVRTMNEVAKMVGGDSRYREMLEKDRAAPTLSVSHSIMAAAREVAENSDVRAICCFTHSGRTAELASRERPRVPIVALTPFMPIARRLTLFWGLHCVHSKEVHRFKHAVIQASETVEKMGLAKGDDLIVITAGVPFNKVGSTNILRVAQINQASMFAGE
jgi:pyruvate kinase